MPKRCIPVATLAVFTEAFHLKTRSEPQFNWDAWTIFCLLLFLIIFVTVLLEWIACHGL